MYGRFGLHTEATQSALLPNYLLDKYAQIFNIISEIVFKGGYTLISYSLNEPPMNGKGGDSKLIKEYTKGLKNKCGTSFSGYCLFPNDY